VFQFCFYLKISSGIFPPFSLLLGKQNSFRQQAVAREAKINKMWNGKKMSSFKNKAAIILLCSLFGSQQTVYDTFRSKFNLDCWEIFQEKEQVIIL
jgi:hypothetical protein